MADSNVQDSAPTVEGTGGVDPTSSPVADEVLGSWDVGGPSSPRTTTTKSKRRGKAHLLRIDLTKDNSAIAEVGWDSEPADMIWTASDAKRFVKWYHIDKVFPENRWVYHHKQGVALNHTCTDPHFKHRVLEVTRVLFPGNEKALTKSSYNLLAMVYVDLRLRRKVDWRTVVTKSKSSRTAYPHADIPDTYDAHHEDHEAVRSDTVSAVSAGNLQEPRAEVNAPLIIALEGVQAVEPPGVTLVGETSERQTQWTDDTFEDPKVALEGLKVLSRNLQAEVEEHKRELQQYDLKAKENDSALAHLAELKLKNDALESELTQLRKDVIDGTFASTSREGEVQTLQDMVDASNMELANAKAEAVALRLDVEVMQMTLSAAESALENRSNDLNTCRIQIRELTHLYESEKAVRLECLSSMDNEQRSEVQRLLDRIADMQRVVDEQAVGNMVDNLTDEILGDSSKATIDRRQARLRRPRISTFLPSVPVGIASDSHGQLSLALQNEMAVAAEHRVPTLESLREPPRGSCTVEPNEDPCELDLPPQQPYELHQTWIGVEIARQVEEQVAKEREEVGKRIVEGVCIEKKAFGNALFERAVMEEAQKRVEALVHADKLKDVRTEYERGEFNQAVAAAAEKRLADLTKSSILDGPPCSSPDEIGWLNWALNANIKEKQIVLARHKLALRSLLCPDSVSSIGEPPKDSEAWLADAPPPVVTHWADEAKMMERLVHSRENRKGPVNWAVEVEEGWTPYPVKTANLDPSSKAAVHPGYPPEWMMDESTCALCCEGFGPEGCFQLGTCGHRYHVTCLTRLAIQNATCMYCGAPLPRRLYELFGIAHRMPYGHEYNRWTLPLDQEPHMFLNYKFWGKPMRWNPETRRHDVYTSTSVDEMFWMTSDFEVESRARAIDSDEQRELFCRNFGGHWSLENGQFFRFPANNYAATTELEEECREDKELKEIREKYALEPIGRARFLLKLEEAAQEHCKIGTAEDDRVANAVKAFEGRINKVVGEWRDALHVALQTSEVPLTEGDVNKFISKVDGALRALRSAEEDLTPERTRKRRREEGDDFSPETRRQFAAMDDVARNRGEAGPSSPGYVRRLRPRPREAIVFTIGTDLANPVELDADDSDI